MLLTAPSLSVSRRSCVFEKKRIASPSALHAGSCAPSVPASGSAPIRIERATPQRRRPCASCDEDYVPFVGGDRAVERLVAGAELSARWSAECEREWRRRWWRHLAKVPHNRNGKANDGQGERDGDPCRARHGPTLALCPLKLRTFGSTSPASARRRPSSRCRSRSRRVPARGGRRRSCPSSPRTGSRPSARRRRR